MISEHAGPPPERYSVPFMQSVPVELHRPEDADGSLVVALHGQGMSPRTFGREALPALPARATVVLPQAPLPFEIRKDGGRFRQGNAWYVYLGDTPEFLASMEAAENWLRYVLDATLARGGLDASRVALLGFSQGGYLAGFVGLRDPARYGRLVVAGARLKHEVLADAARAAAQRDGYRVLAVHGEHDEGVRLAPTRASVEQVRAWGVDVTLQTYATAHHVLRDEACQGDVRRFLEGGN